MTAAPPSREGLDGRERAGGKAADAAHAGWSPVLLAGRGIGLSRWQILRRHVLPVLLRRQPVAAPKWPVTDRWSPAAGAGGPGGSAGSAAAGASTIAPAAVMPLAPVLLEARTPLSAFALREGESLALRVEDTHAVGLALGGLRALPGLDVAFLGHGRPLSVRCVPADAGDGLPPRLRVGALLAESLAVARPGLGAAERESLVVAGVREVGLDKTVLARYPGQLAAGQRRRIAVARALASGPAVLVLEEPLASLSVNEADGLLAALAERQRRHNLACLVVTQDARPFAAFVHQILG